MEKISILNYGVYVGSNILPNLTHLLSEELLSFSAVKRVLVVTDQNIADVSPGFSVLKEQFEKAGLPCHFVVLPAGETTKCAENLYHLYDEFYAFGITRSDLIIAFGGGVIGDLTGFAAATFLRGVPYVHIPTSLLAQVDSSLGGKTAINIAQGKNLVGTFYQPAAVIIDTDLLKTLPRKYFSDGMAEIIKYGCIASSRLFGTLQKAGCIDRLQEVLTDIIFICCEIKKSYIEEDEKDTGARMLLNFGHTIGHALEKHFHYSDTYTHGQCVAIGMYVITRQSEHFGLTESGSAEKIKKLLSCYDLPHELPGSVTTEALVAIAAGDKKKAGNTMPLVILTQIGKAFLHKIDSAAMGDFLR